ncbi:AAA family ATPase [Planococcus lenghuensis]|nr:AAA family ATPase [Planococcus lenghuensis]
MTGQARKIHIIGSVGSGKTTLARKLSEQLGILHIELDNVVWKRGPNGDIRRTIVERDSVLHKILETEDWIIEGAHFGWVAASFEQADLIILLDTNWRVRTYRIIRRFCLQRFGSEQANYKPTFHMLRKMFRWSADFDRQHRTEILNSLHQYGDKVIVAATDRDIRSISG